MENTTKIQIGDVLCGDFGCTMTLPAFYRVVSITPSGKSAKVRRLSAANSSSDGGWTGTCVPTDSFSSSEIITCRIKRSSWSRGDKFEYVTIHNHMFTMWNGKPQYFDHWD